MQSYAPAQQLLSSLALKQLQQFVHVGVMDLLDESIAALAVSVCHAQLAVSKHDLIALLTLPYKAVLPETMSVSHAKLCLCTTAAIESGSEATAAVSVCWGDGVAG